MCKEHRFCFHGNENMRNGRLKKLALAVFSGAILFQAPGCVETAVGLSTVASLVTAGGVIYLIRKVLE
jgi:hypothetical protein